MTLAIERKNLILEKLQENKKVVVSQLSEEFGVSEETIRRDLDKLEQEGFAIKSYGGAILNENTNNDIPFLLREKKNFEGKKVIANIIADMIADGEHIIVDPSSTAVAIIRALQEKDKKHLSIITNSVEVLLELGDKDDWEIISTGGRLVENYLALVGPLTTSSIRSFHADKVILSCKGIDMSRGITDANDQFSHVKELMLHAADTKILAVDATKFDTVAFSQICALSEFDIVVTDNKPSDAWLSYFKERGITVKYGN